MTIQKSSIGILRVAPHGETPTVLGTPHGRGIVTFSVAQRQERRASARGRPATRPFNLYDPFVETLLLDNAETAELFGWFYANGKQWDVDWRPEGDGTGKPVITFTGDCLIGLTAAADRTRRLRITGTRAFTEGVQT